MNFSTIFKEMEKEFPKFRLVIKSKSKFMKFLYKATLMKWWCPDFMDHFTTTVGQTVYMPKYLITTSSGAEILRHERVHMRDSRGIWKTIFFGLTYVLLPLPVVITGRAWWELRAYKESLRCHIERYGSVSEEDLDWYVSQFTGSSYFFMFPFRRTVRKLFAKYSEEILNENKH